MTGEGTRCQPGECTYPCTNRVGVTPIGSHMGGSSPELGYSESAGAVTTNRIRTERTSCPPHPRSAHKRYAPYRLGALLLIDDDCRPLSLLP